MRRTTLLGTLAGLTTTAAVAAATALPAAQAAAPSYVALGDSYSSGTGTRSYIDDGTDCLRSTYAYPSLIAAARGYALNFRACSGATVPDVAATQLGALTSGTSYVSVSVGGNDAGFADVLTECAQPAWMSDCFGAIEDARRYIDTTLPSALTGLYGKIRTRSPQATVVVAGYPRIFNGEDCNAGTWFSPEEEAALNATADRLNAVTRTAATNAGVRFADPTSRFVGHAVCDDVEWINGLSYPIVESYHPNRAGQASGYTPTVSPVLTGTTTAVTRTVRRQARSSATELAAQQRGYAEADRSIGDETVHAPDLRSADARRGARAHGVDLGSRASIDRVDRALSRAQAERWSAGQE